MQTGASLSETGLGAFVVQEIFAAKNRYQQWSFSSITNPNERNGLTALPLSLLTDFIETQNLLLLPNPAQNQVTVGSAISR